MNLPYIAGMSLLFMSRKYNSVNNSKYLSNNTICNYLKIISRQSISIDQNIA